MQPSFFDHQNPLELLERLGDPLPKLEGTCKRPLNEREQAANRKRSNVRARVKHVFTQQADRLIRTIGKARAEIKIGLMNLVYNMRRMAWLAGCRMGDSD
jgi:hypothetical protein